MRPGGESLSHRLGAAALEAVVQFNQQRADAAGPGSAGFEHFLLGAFDIDLQDVDTVGLPGREQVGDAHRGKACRIGACGLADAEGPRLGFGIQNLQRARAVPEALRNHRHVAVCTHIPAQQLDIASVDLERVDLCQGESVREVNRREPDVGAGIDHVADDIGERDVEFAVDEDLAEAFNVGTAGAQEHRIAMARHVHRERRSRAHELLLQQFQPEQATAPGTVAVAERQCRVCDLREHWTDLPAQVMR